MTGMPTTPTTSGSSTRGPSTRERMRRAPVETGLGMVPDPSSTAERIRLRAPITDDVRTDDGRLLPVLPALLADSGIGYLVFATAKLVAGAPTVDLRLDLTGVPAPDARWLTADLSLLHLDDEIGIGRAEMTDDTGAPVAHAVVSMALTAVPDRPGGLASGGGAIDADRTGPGRTGGGTGGGTGGDTDFRSALPPFDPARLRPENLELDGGDVVFTPGASTVNLNGTTHGAVLTGVGAAAQARHLADPGARPLSLTVDFLRPVQVDAPLRIRTGTVRDGRRFWTLRTELLLPDGRPAVRVTGGGIRRTA
jgi:acyl-coenzyme A thioesterase PaaI-like protein